MTTRGSRWRSLVTLALALAGIAGVAPSTPAAWAPAALVTISEFPLAANSQPVGITAGPDGNVWFTEYAGNKIGRITPAGAIIEFPIPTANSGPLGITAGPDGNLWFTELNANKIGRITPTGGVTEFPRMTFGLPWNITAGPDGNLWFTDWWSRQIGRVTPTGMITEFSGPWGAPIGITAGPDGNLWFTDLGGWIGRISPTGVVTFPVAATGAGPLDITTGPDSNLWFVENFVNKIGRITPAGGLTEFTVPTANSFPAGITAGPDGNLWFTAGNNVPSIEPGGNKIGRITPTGAITEFPIPTPGSAPWGITAGPDGNVWFTEQFGNKIGRVNLAITLVSTGTGAGGGPHVRLFSFDRVSATATPLGGGFMVYDAGFTGGVQATLVTVGGTIYLVTGVGSGGGPHIKLFRVTDLATGSVAQIGSGFMAYDPAFTGGARIAAMTDEAGDLLIVTGVGSGGGPHVKVFRVTDLATGAVVQLGDGFFAYDPGFTGGVNVGAQ